MGLLNNNYVCALDIGSSKISACLAQLKGGRVSGVDFASVPSRGVRGGVIVDSVELVNAVSALMKEIKVKRGISVKYVYTAISGRDILTKHSHAIIPLAERGSKVITTADIRKVNEQARILGSSLDDEIIHMIPASYTIDTKSSIINPLGLYSHRLESDVFLICAKVPAVQGISRMINQAGCEIRELFFSGLVSSRLVLNTGPRDGYAVFCDIGSDITDVLIFGASGLQHVDILHMGGHDITMELCSELKIALDLAEELKRSYGIVGHPEQIGDEKEILIKKTAAYRPIKQRVVAEIVTCKAHALCAAIKETVEKNVPLHEVGSFVAVGRSLMMEGFIEALESTFAIPVKVGRLPDDSLPCLVREQQLFAGQNYLAYLTVLGIVDEVICGSQPSACVLRDESVKNPVVKAVRRFVEVYQEYF